MELLSHIYGFQYRLWNWWHGSVMGFSASLQGETSHAALLARQDAELRLLDTMRRVLVARAKCDRDYAAALTQLAHTAAKMDAPDNVLDDSHLHKLQEAVGKSKNNYEQALEHYKTSKTKYEDQFLKGKPGRKLDELKERYQKACKKLHQVHNDYVLLLCEAADYERDFRTVLLPGLLEYQERVQEDMIDKWRSILTEVCELTDTTQGRYAQLQTEVVSSVSAISPKSEYSSFSETNNHNTATYTIRSSPPDPVTFEFCNKLLGDGVGSLQAGQLAVDSLTVDSLRLRLSDIEHRLHEVSTELREKQNLLNQHETEVVNIKKNSLQDTGIASRLLVLKRASDVLRRELNELRCKESWLQHQRSLIHDPLAALGCEEAPQPWEAAQGQVNGDSYQRSDSLKSRSAALKELLRKPFRARNSASPASTPPTPTRANTEERASAPDQQSLTTDNSAEGQAEVHPQAVNGIPELTYDPDRCLEDEPWFHGVLPREEVVRLLVNEGNYLGHYRFEGPAFPTIQELILHQHNCGLPVTNKSGAILRTPIFRERWELNNDDVELRDKIGRGNFGDVYKARLRDSGSEVAVKTCRVTLPDEQKKKFLQEGRILKQYDHPNIVKFIGICVQKQPIMIVMELVPGGSLLSFVRNHKGQLNGKQMMGMCLDTASGMAYLESKNCIHRDLAARNCLVGHRNIVKISDFGMSREEEEYIVSDGMKQIPIKWTAPEALNFGKYTSLCDVWSYAVLCWEIFSSGEVPYHGYSNTKAREMIDSGYRMLAPHNTPDEMYQLMLKCWQYDAENRPHFPEIYAAVDTIYSSL
ncbi:Tyrosine-protein kinase Fer-like [Homarus americanus]|uniref:Tyrosine-protein kinase n=1 Tax=Homarus americanus TaxID=6706 RepID=A0A8J5N086_HOMAM|nr:Tyrosine-protein kinase Fer-like [Homarus americanus]